MRSRGLLSAAAAAAAVLLHAAPARAASYTVSGLVFADANGNGIPDAGEPGVPGAIVSDGTQFVSADGTGRYTLVVSGGPILWVRVPAGFAPGVGFWRQLGGPPPGDVDFPLRPDPTTAGPTLTFAQLSDVHMGYADANTRSLVSRDDFAHVLARLAIDAFAPSFVVATGDLAQAADPAQYADYRSAIGSIGVPVASLPGNHDWYDGGAAYRAALGPTMYSFDAGPCHFVMANSNLPSWSQAAATFIDTEAAAGGIPAGTPILVAEHYPPVDSDIQLLAMHGVRFILSGHWHSSRVYLDVDGVTHVNTPPAVFGGIDLTPGGYRIVTLSATGGTTTAATLYRPTPLAPSLAAAFPADGGTVVPGTVTALASAIGWVEDATVSASLDGAPLPAATFRGGYSYGVDGVDLRAPGPHTLTWSVVPAAGGAPLATASASFTVAAPKTQAPQPGADWAAFHGGPDHTGAASDMLLPPLTLAWAAPTGGFVNMASPIVKDGLVFQAVMDFDGGGTAGVVALDGATGRRLWFFATQSPAESTAAAAGGLVLVTTQDGTLYALDEQTGAMRWSAALQPSAASMKTRDDVWMYAGPVVDGQKVLVGATPEFLSLDLASGAPSWQVDTQWQWLMTYSTPAADSGLAFAVFGRGRGPDSLGAYDEATGAVKWVTSDDTAGMEASPAVANGTVYVASGTGVLYALRTTDGSPLWQQTMVSGANDWGYDLVSTPTVGPDRVYMATATGVVQAFDRASGQPRWMFTEGGMPGANAAPFKSAVLTITSSPALSGEVLYVAGNDGILYALAAHDGNPGCTTGPALGGCILWSASLGAPTSTSPAISGNFLYIATLSGMVYAFAGTTAPLPVSMQPAGGCGCAVGGASRGAAAGGAVALLLAIAGLAAVARRRRLVYKTRGPCR